MVVEMKTERINPQEVVEHYVETGFVPQIGQYYHDEGDTPFCGAGCWAHLKGFSRNRSEDDDTEEYVNMSVTHFLYSVLEIIPAYIDGYTWGFDYGDESRLTAHYRYLNTLPSIMPYDEREERMRLFDLGFDDGAETRALLLEDERVDSSWLEGAYA